MAHKTNNPIHELGAQPFEQMLRRRLQRGDALATPCAGFDAEMANAYLERALLASTQQIFVAHLADCSGCRQHVTALARLNIALAPAPVAVTKQQSAAEPFWTRWTAQASAWWSDLSGLSWNWGLASAGATACVLIAALALNSLQQGAQQPPAASVVINTAAPESDSLREANAVPEGAAMTDLNVPAETATAAIVARETVLSKTDSVASNQAINLQLPTAPALPEFAPSTFAAPAPVVAPLRGIELPQDTIAFSERPSAPVVTIPSTGDFFGSTPRQGGQQGVSVAFNQNGQSGLTPIRLNSIEPSAPLNSLNVKDQLERQAALSEIASVEAKRLERAAENKESKVGKGEPGTARTLLNTLLTQRNALGFAAKQKADAPTKEAEKTAESPIAKPLTKQVNGHTLYFERGTWIDGEYKSSMTLPLIKLVRGSQRYQQVLIDNPMLEEFFQLAPVIVVWKGKIYEVRKSN